MGLLSACAAQDASRDNIGGKADDPNGVADCIGSTIGTIPPADESTFVTDACLVFNNDEFEAARSSARDDGDNVIKAAGFTHIRRIEDATDAIRVAQLVATLEYFHRPFDRDTDFGEMNLAELDDAAENAFWRETVIDTTGEVFTHVNIGMGDNPHEVVFRSGTLEPVAVTQDDSLTFCADSLVGEDFRAPERECSRICGERSQACGDSCISLDKTCRKGPGTACEG